MSEEKNVLMYKGHPLMRKDNLIYYGSMADSHIVMLQILETKKVGGTTWGRISNGWISLDYVVLDQVKEESKEEVKEEQKPAVPETTTPPVQPDKEETKPSTPATPAKMTGKVKVNDFLRIRKGAGTGYAVAGYLKPNAKVEILETKTVDGVQWGRIVTGWISLEYTK